MRRLLLLLRSRGAVICEGLAQRIPLRNHAAKIQCRRLHFWAAMNRRPSSFTPKLLLSHQIRRGNKKKDYMKSWLRIIDEVAEVLFDLTRLSWPKQSIASVPANQSTNARFKDVWNTTCQNVIPKVKSAFNAGFVKLFWKKQ